MRSHRSDDSSVSYRRDTLAPDLDGLIMSQYIISVPQPWAGMLIGGKITSIALPRRFDRVGTIAIAADARAASFAPINTQPRGLCEQN